MCCLSTNLRSYAFMNTTITAFSFHVNTVSFSMKFMSCWLQHCCEMCYYLLNNILYRAFVKSQKIVPAHAHFGKMLVFNASQLSFHHDCWYSHSYFPSVQSPVIVKGNGRITSKTFLYKILIWIKTLTTLTGENQSQF